MREVSEFGGENLAVRVGRPVVMQFSAVRVPALPVRQPFGARVDMSQVSERSAENAVVVFAERVFVSTTRPRTESLTEIERERVRQ